MEYFTRELVDFHDKPGTFIRKGKEKKAVGPHFDKTERFDRTAPLRKAEK